MYHLLKSVCGMSYENGFRLKQNIEIFFSSRKNQLIINGSKKWMKEKTNGLKKPKSSK